MDNLSSLLADLSCGNDERAEAAALGLPEHGEAAFVALQELLRSGHIDTRWWAVRALAEWPKSDKVTRELLTALEDDSKDVRQCAVMALGRHPDPQAVLPFIRALSDPDLMTSQLACNALISIGAEAVPALIEFLQTGTRAAELPRQRHAGSILSQGDDVGLRRHDVARLEAVRALAEIKDPRAIPALMRVLAENSTVIQYWAERGLDKLGLGMVYIKPE
jgi:HEAT repeat protein